jgi:hypothetical protein
MRPPINSTDPSLSSLHFIQRKSIFYDKVLKIEVVECHSRVLLTSITSAIIYSNEIDLQSLFQIKQTKHWDKIWSLTRIIEKSFHFSDKFRQISRSYLFGSQMALQSVIKIDHTLSISISIWVVDQSLAHDQQKVIKRSNRSRSANRSPKSGCNKLKINTFSDILLCERKTWPANCHSGQDLPIGMKSWTLFGKK